MGLMWRTSIDDKGRIVIPAPIRELAGWDVDLEIIREYVPGYEILRRDEALPVQLPLRIPCTLGPISHCRIDGHGRLHVPRFYVENLNLQIAVDIELLGTTVRVWPWPGRSGTPLESAANFISSSALACGCPLCISRNPKKRREWHRVKVDQAFRFVVPAEIRPGSNHPLFLIKGDDRRFFFKVHFGQELFHVQPSCLLIGKNFSALRSFEERFSTLTCSDDRGWAFEEVDSKGRLVIPKRIRDECQVTEIMYLRDLGATWEVNNPEGAVFGSSMRMEKGDELYVWSNDKLGWVPTGYLRWMRNKVGRYSDTREGKSLAIGD